MSATRLADEAAAWVEAILAPTLRAAWHHVTGHPVTHTYAGTTVCASCYSTWPADRGTP